MKNRLWQRRRNGSSSPLLSHAPPPPLSWLLKGPFRADSQQRPLWPPNDSIVVLSWKGTEVKGGGVRKKEEDNVFRITSHKTSPPSVSHSCWVVLLLTIQSFKWHFHCSRLYVSFSLMASASAESAAVWVIDELHLNLSCPGADTHTHTWTQKSRWKASQTMAWPPSCLN